MDTNGSGAISGPEPSSAPPLACLRATTRSQTAAHTSISSSAAAGRRSSFSAAASSVGRIALSTAAAAAEANAMAAIDSKLRRGPRKRGLGPRVGDGAGEFAGEAGGRRQRRRLSPSRSGVSGTGAAVAEAAPCAWRMLSPDVVSQIMSRYERTSPSCRVL